MSSSSGHYYVIATATGELCWGQLSSRAAKKCSCTAGVAVLLSVSLLSLLSVVGDVNNMQTETLEQMGEFKVRGQPRRAWGSQEAFQNLADATWKSLTDDSMFILGVRQKRGGGYDTGAGGGGGGGYAVRFVHVFLERSCVAKFCVIVERTVVHLYNVLLITGRRCCGRRRRRRVPVCRQGRWMPRWTARSSGRAWKPRR